MQSGQDVGQRSPASALASPAAFQTRGQGGFGSKRTVFAEPNQNLGSVAVDISHSRNLLGKLGMILVALVDTESIDP